MEDDLINKYILEPKHQPVSTVGVDRRPKDAGVKAGGPDEAKRTPRGWQSTATTEWQRASARILTSSGVWRERAGRGKRRKKEEGQNKKAPWTRSTKAKKRPPNE